MVKTNNEIVKPKLDVIFKRIFTDVSNKNLLESLLESLLNLENISVKDITLRNTENLPNFVGGKFSVMDLLVEVQKTLIDIEIQLLNHSMFAERSLFYLSKTFSDNLANKENYTSLKQTIGLNILNFKMFDWEEVKSTFSMYEPTQNHLLTDKFQLYYFELPKLNMGKTDPNNKQDLWLKFINAESEEELEMLQKTNVPEIKQAVSYVKKMTDDELIREEARVREKALHDEVSLLYDARKKGIEEATQEFETRLKEIRKKMEDKGFSDEEIDKILN